MALFGTKQKKSDVAKVAVGRARAARLADGVAHNVVRAPWLSEKALLATEHGIYTFSVPLDASKAEIAGAIKELYNVEPRAVRVANVKGKRKAMRTRRGVGQRSARRKAYVYLKAGDTIQFA